MKKYINKFQYSKKIMHKAQKIKCIATDIDGVLTNGDMIIRDSGEEIKTWNVKDRIAFYYAHQFMPEIKFAWITGRKSNQVEQQARDIKIDALYMDCMDKKKAIENIMNQFSFTQDEIAFIGDDLIDIPVLKMIGLAVCPSDAALEVQACVDFVSTFPGGRGVLRETVELVMKARGAWERVVAEYMQ